MEDDHVSLILLQHSFLLQLRNKTLFYGNYHYQNIYEILHITVEYTIVPQRNMRRQETLLIAWL